MKKQGDPLCKASPCFKNIGPGFALYFSSIIFLTDSKPVASNL